jgi:uncharacterized protein
LIFIDTGAFLARVIQRDQHHDAAQSHWEVLRNGQRRCFTSNFVLDETITLLGRRAGYHFAAERARAIYSSDALTILRPLGGDESAALDLFEKYADQGVSFTDCISFVLMAGHGIRTAFSFDNHFLLAGFEIEP